MEDSNLNLISVRNFGVLAFIVVEYRDIFFV